ncbi:MAG TPA: bifunctional (p)ppGpp synthetase/guanosine-3',5'-bis(diphosphate) 3'-pyrophosphohydrolase, partial [Leptospiraceae bacterium]|nr:bifunctional (p)ppGpp synthetase/guanosine-3',5'-bis(diphosphate) 3'-pyrophosphohydrolase [Leptospiraceae bacterium]
LQKAIPVRVHVSAYDRPKIYMEIVGAISKTDTNILEAGATATGEGTVLAKFLLEIEHLDQLKEILDNIKSIPNIITVERTKT